MSKIKGEQLYMFMKTNDKWQPIGCSTDCSLNLSAEPIEISKRGIGAWRCFRAGSKSWGMDCAGFYFDSVLPTNFIQGADMVGSIIRVAMSVLEKSIIEAGVDLQTIAPHQTHTLVGDALITSCEYSGSRGGMATYKITVQGSGALTPII